MVLAEKGRENTLLLRTGSWFSVDGSANTFLGSLKKREVSNEFSSNLYILITLCDFQQILFPMQETRLWKLLET